MMSQFGSLNQNFPLAKRFWQGLTPAERVTLFVLMEVTTNSEYPARDMIEFVRNVGAKESLCEMRMCHIAQMEELLEKKTGAGLQDFINRLCATIKQWRDRV